MRHTAVSIKSRKESVRYLDIIESGKSRSRGEELRYIASCREKAFQLKEMSDKLFQYFLVFGSQEGREKNYEVFDAGILIQQLISEHSAAHSSTPHSSSAWIRAPDRAQVCR